MPSRVSLLLACVVTVLSHSTEGADMDDFEKLKPYAQLRALSQPAETAVPLGTYTAIVDGWELSFQAPADDVDIHKHGFRFRHSIDTRSERYAKAFKAFGEPYEEGVFSFSRNYRIGFSYLSSQLGQLDVTCRVGVYTDQSEWNNESRRDFMIPADVIKALGPIYSAPRGADYMLRSRQDGKLYPPGDGIKEIVIDGRKWFHGWHLNEFVSREGYFTGLAKDRFLVISIRYNLFIPEKYYHPDSPRPDWIKTSYESVNTIMSSIKLKPPPGYDERSDPYIVKSTK